MDVTATITGNLAADPRLTHLPDGTPVCELRVMVSRRRLVDGQWQQQAPRAFTVTAFGDLARNTTESAHRGDRVTVAADDIYSDAWASRDNGEPMSAVKIRASEIALALRFATGTATRVTTASQPQAGPVAAAA